MLKWNCTSNSVLNASGKHSTSENDTTAVSQSRGKVLEVGIAAATAATCDSVACCSSNFRGVSFLLIKLCPSEAKATISLYLLSCLHTTRMYIKKDACQQAVLRNRSSLSPSIKLYI